MFAVSTLMDFMTVNTLIVSITVNTLIDFMTDSVFFFVSSKPLPTSLILMKTRSSSAFVAGVVVQALFHLKPSSSMALLGDHEGLDPLLLHPTTALRLLLKRCHTGELALDLLMRSLMNRLQMA